MTERKDNSHENNNNHTHNGHHEHIEHNNNEIHNHLEHNHEDHNEHGNNHNHEHIDHNEQHNHDHHNHHEWGHDHHHHGNFKELFLKSLPLAIPILILSPMMGITLPLQFTFQYSDIIVGILSTILLIYGGKPFYQGAVDEFKQKSPGMMALVSLGISVSYL